MAVRVKKLENLNMIHSRPESRNAMDPISADKLTDAILERDDDDSLKIAVFCAVWD